LASRAGWRVLRAGRSGFVQAHPTDGGRISGRTTGRFQARRTRRTRDAPKD
jgi:hypothetical protein